MQLVDSMRQLHDLSIMHRDISMENLLVFNFDDEGRALDLRVIDFGQACTQRHFSKCLTGKKSYQAPELHSGSGTIDGFLSDAFAVGVTCRAHKSICPLPRGR
jgi:serine/threonine protein kinase